MKKKRRLTPFGVAVKQRLVAKQMTQVELAEKVGTSNKYLNLILYGERSGQKYIEAIAAQVGLEQRQLSALLTPARLDK